MKHSRSAIKEEVCVPDRLPHGLRYVQPLNPLDLNVNARQADKVGDLPEAHAAASLHRVAVFSQQSSQLSLSFSAFAL